MASFAEIRSDNNKVLRVIVVADENLANNGGEYTAESENWVAANHVEDPIIKQELGGTYPETYWKQTSYNTKEGIHLNGGTAKRKNFAGIGYTYDSSKDAFIPPKDHNWKILDEEKCIWVDPIAQPSNTTFNYNDVDYLVGYWYDLPNNSWKGYSCTIQNKGEINETTIKHRWVSWNQETESWTDQGEYDG
jgi:hypothetical protein